MKASFSTREQLGQLMMLSVSRPKSTTLRTRPAAMSARICRPAAISSRLRALGTVSETRIVSPMPRLMSCSKAMRVLMIAVGRQAGLGHAQVQRHVGPLLGEAAIDLDHLGRIGILQRHAVAREAERIEQLAMLPGACEHRRERIVARRTSRPWPDRPSRSSRRRASRSRSRRRRRPGT